MDALNIGPKSMHFIERSFIFQARVFKPNLLFIMCMKVGENAKLQHISKVMAAMPKKRNTGV